MPVLRFCYPPVKDSISPVQCFTAASRTEQILMQNFIVKNSLQSGFIISWAFLLVKGKK